MTDKALADLQAIVDRLGPDVWLELNQVSFPRYFGVSLGSGQAPEAARIAVAAFAERNRLALVFDDVERVVRIGRAYYKQDADA